jgi:predicted O-methyltransferase YrrM
MNYSVPIHLRNPPTHDKSEIFDHTNFIAFLASFIKPDIFLELGVAKGNVSKAVSKYCQKVIGVDIGDHVENKPENMELHVMKTQEFKDILKENNYLIDMCFIDADHRSQAVYDDFCMVYPHMNDNGFILLHDTFPTAELTHDGACSDSFRVPQLIKDNFKDCEVLTFCITPGLTVIRKNTLQLPWMI